MRMRLLGVIGVMTRVLTPQGRMRRRLLGVIGVMTPQERMSCARKIEEQRERFRKRKLRKKLERYNMVRELANILCLKFGHIEGSNRKRIPESDSTLAEILKLLKIQKGSEHFLDYENGGKRRFVLVIRHKDDDGTTKEERVELGESSLKKRCNLA